MRIVIIGNGVAGITCALAARRRSADAHITVIGDETPYFFSRTALMYAFTNAMTRRDLEPYERGEYKQQRIELVHGRAIRVDTSARVVTTADGRELPWDRLVLATGARPRRADWAGLEACREGVLPFVSMRDLDRWEALVPTTRDAVVVGGGLIGIELVECLVHHGIRTTFLLRDPWYWPVALGREEAALITRTLGAHGVDVICDDRVARVDADTNGRITAVHTSAGRSLAAQALGVCIGVEPALDRLPQFDTPPQTSRGIVTNAAFETSLKHVYAIGDCAEVCDATGATRVETLWYSAKRHGELLGQSGLFGDTVSYVPPIFFNSSKFLNIEYTTVGMTQDAPAGTPSIRLHDDARGISVRIVHNGERVLGLNGLGSRWDHSVWMKWVHEQRPPAWVERHLAESQYDHEFGRLRLHRLQRDELPIVRGAP